MYAYHDMVPIPSVSHICILSIIYSSIAAYRISNLNFSMTIEWMKKNKKMVSCAAFLKVVNINNKWAQKPKFNIQNFENSMKFSTSFFFTEKGSAQLHLLVHRKWMTKNIQIFCRANALKWHVTMNSSITHWNNESRALCLHTFFREKTVDYKRSRVSPSIPIYLPSRWGNHLTSWMWNWVIALYASVWLFFFLLSATIFPFDI